MSRSGSQRSRLESRARSAAARADARLRKTSERLQEWRRARIDPIMQPAAVALAPATARVGDWRDRWMASEYAPATIARCKAASAQAASACSCGRATGPSA